MQKKLLILFTSFIILFCFKSNAQSVGGNDFWFTFPLNFANGQTGTPGQNQLVFVSGCNVNGTITFPALGSAPISFTVAPGAATTINLTANNNTLSEQVQSNGIHITTDNLVSTYAVDYAPFTVDGEAVLPTSMLGTDYVVMGYSDGGDNLAAQFTVLGTQAGTTVTITTAVSTSANVGTTQSHAPNTSWNVNLNAGQTYMVSAKSPASLLTTNTGTRIHATKPIVVISHTPCTNYICASCDMIMCEFLPTNLWGTKYITAQAQARIRTAGRTLADYIEIVAGAAGANVNIAAASGNTVVPLAAYKSYIYANPAGVSPDPGEANMVITSNNPIQVSQYSQGVACDNSNNTDPEHIFIYPETMWISDYTFSCSTLLTTVSAGVTLVVNSAVSGTTGFKIDATAIPSIGWTTIGTSTYKYLRYTVAPGPHHLTNTNNTPFSFYQYAVGNDESYIVQGGSTFTNCLLVVPIRLLSFDATRVSDNSVRLDWKTATETNSGSFSIERNLDGSIDGFKAIGRMVAAGNSTELKSYSFTDEDLPKDKVAYYRLKQYDLNGAFQYSNITQIIPKKMQIISDNIRLINNLVTTDLSFLVDFGTDNISKEIDVEIINPMGVIVKKVTLFVGEDPKNSISVSDLSNGIYYAKFTNPTLSTLKIIKFLKN